MYSLHQKQRREQGRLKSEKVIRARSPISSIKKDVNCLSASSNTRIQNIYRDASPELQQMLRNGVVPLIHPNRHEFRENKSICPNIYVRNYLTQKEKIETICEDFKKNHLAPEKYSKLSDDWLCKPISSPINTQKQNKKTIVLERVQRNASQHSCYRLEPGNGFDTKNPKFRKISKKKWVGKALSKDQTTWKLIDSMNKEPYIDGFEVTGDFSRKRNRNKESSHEFIATSPKDIWNKIIPRPVSNCNFYTETKSKSLINSSKIYPKSFESSRNNLS